MSELHVTVVDVEPNPTADQSEAVLFSADAGAPQLRAGTGAQRAGWVRAIGAALKAGCTGLVDLATAEAHLPPAGLEVILTRTACRLDDVAGGAGSPALLGIVVEAADPDYPVMPRPDLAPLDPLPDSTRGVAAAD